jgi:hypothetical protein
MLFCSWIVTINEIFPNRFLIKYVKLNSYAFPSWYSWPGRKVTPEKNFIPSNNLGISQNSTQNSLSKTSSVQALGQQYWCSTEILTVNVEVLATIPYVSTGTSTEKSVRVLGDYLTYHTREILTRLVEQPWPVSSLLKGLIRWRQFGFQFHTEREVFNVWIDQ